MHVTRSDTLNSCYTAHDHLRHVLNLVVVMQRVDMLVQVPVAVSEKKWFGRKTEKFWGVNTKEKLRELGGKGKREKVDNDECMWERQRDRKRKRSRNNESQRRQTGKFEGMRQEEQETLYAQERKRSKHTPFIFFLFTVHCHSYSANLAMSASRDLSSSRRLSSCHGGEHIKLKQWKRKYWGGGKRVKERGWTCPSILSRKEKEERKNDRQTDRQTEMNEKKGEKS